MSKPEHPERTGSDEELQRERDESTDLGYRDTEEERAYERDQDAQGGQGDPPAPDEDAAVGGG